MQVFHHYNNNHSPLSAKVIVPKIMDLFNPKSVIDIGCGIGQWLSVFMDYGVENIQGLDGSHITATDLLIPHKHFKTVNLFHAETIILKDSYDLVLSLEVAEHLPESNADTFVKLLVDSGDTILFSAAIPGQTGENHYNEQWPTYWQKKFLVHGFYFYDLLRSEIWNNEDVNWWYRQNVFVVSNKVEIFEKYNSSIFNGQLIIHPKLLEMYIYLINEKKKKNKLLFYLKKIKNEFGFSNNTYKESSQKIIQMFREYFL